MDKIRIPDEDIVPLEHVAAGVSGMRVLFVNVYAVVAKDGWVLVDAALPMSGGRIRGWAEDHFGKGTAPRSIVLTHGHFDHVGALEDLLEQWDVPVYAHPLEMPYLTGQLRYPPPEPRVGGGLMAVISPLYPRDPINLGTRVRELPADGRVPDLPDWRWIHTPGHTQGRVSLFRPDDSTLVVGDAFCTTKQESFLAVATQKPELHGPPAYYTPDWDAARDSVKRLAALSPERLAPGHGMPMAGDDVPELVLALADHFEEIAVPAQGRYSPAR